MKNTGNQRIQFPVWENWLFSSVWKIQIICGCMYPQICLYCFFFRCWVGQWSMCCVIVSRPTMKHRTNLVSLQQSPSPPFHFLCYLHPYPIYPLTLHVLVVSQDTICWLHWQGQLATLQPSPLVMVQILSPGGPDFWRLCEQFQWRRKSQELFVPVSGAHV